MKLFPCLVLSIILTQSTFASVNPDPNVDLQHLPTSLRQHAADFRNTVSKIKSIPNHPLDMYIRNISKTDCASKSDIFNHSYVPTDDNILLHDMNNFING